MRYANFNFLKEYGIIAIQDMSIIPNSFDWTWKMNFHGAKLGDLELFSIGGKSRAGNEASANKTDILKGYNNDEWLEEDAMAVVGIKHLKTFQRRGKPTSVQLPDLLLPNKTGILESLIRIWSTLTINKIGLLRPP